MADPSRWLGARAHGWSRRAPLDLVWVGAMVTQVVNALRGQDAPLIEFPTPWSSERVVESERARIRAMAAEEKARYEREYLARSAIV